MNEIKNRGMWSKSRPQTINENFEEDRILHEQGIDICTNYGCHNSKQKGRLIYNECIEHSSIHMRDGSIHYAAGFLKALDCD